MDELQPIIESYNVSEEYLYSDTYSFIKGAAITKNFINTLKALPLARRMHDGQHRKGKVKINGQEVQLPYVLHVLKVCSTLISLNLPLDDNELDILYASAICHDLLEDCYEYFPNGGTELITDHHLDTRVYEVVKTLSKPSGLDEIELNRYFNTIKYDKLALLVKLSDRSHNVETLSSMTIDKIHKYVDETRRWIYPLCDYGKDIYPELSNGFTILKSKIVSLTEETELLVEMFTAKLAEKDELIKQLQKEIDELKNK